MRPILSLHRQAEILFSSDGHPGLGNKDIFYSKPDGDKWLPPVRLDPPINSEYDDFGIVTDSLMSRAIFLQTDLSLPIFFSLKLSIHRSFTDIQKKIIIVSDSVMKG